MQTPTVLSELPSSTISASLTRALHACAPLHSPVYSIVLHSVHAKDDIKQLQEHGRFSCSPTKAEQVAPGGSSGHWAAFGSASAVEVSVAIGHADAVVALVAHKSEGSQQFVNPERNC